MNEPSVSVRNLRKSFGGRRVVDDLSFDVRKGEVFALLGHNGAGKRRSPWWTGTCPERKPGFPPRF